MQKFPKIEFFIQSYADSTKMCEKARINSPKFKTRGIQTLIRSWAHLMQQNE